MLATFYLSHTIIRIGSIKRRACCFHLIFTLASARRLPRAIFKLIKLKSAPKMPPNMPSRAEGIKARILTEMPFVTCNHEKKGTEIFKAGSQDL